MFRAVLCELSQDQSPGTPAAAGDFGFKVLTSSDPAEKQKQLAAEIANGRLAMMAIIGMCFQDGLTGSAWGDGALYTASFVGELLAFFVFLFFCLLEASWMFPGGLQEVNILKLFFVTRGDARVFFCCPPGASKEAPGGLINVKSLSRQPLRVPYWKLLFYTSPNFYDFLPSQPLELLFNELLFMKLAVSASGAGG